MLNGKYLLNLRLLLVLLSIWLVSSCCNAQSFSIYKSMYTTAKPAISVGLGVASYYGDLQATAIIPKPSLLFEYSKGLTRHIVHRYSLSFYKIGALDSKTGSSGLESRNLSFQSINVEFATIFEFRGFDSHEEKWSVFNPYAFVGIGLTTNSPKADFNGKKYGLRKLRTETIKYSGVTPVIPFGVGIRIKPVSLALLVLEVGYRLTFTDYLDDVSTHFRDPTELSSDMARQLADRRPEIGLSPLKPGSKRGNPEHNDGYIMTSLKLEMQLLGLIRSMSRRKPKFR